MPIKRVRTDSEGASLCDHSDPVKGLCFRRAGHLGRHEFERHPDRAAYRYSSVAFGGFGSGVQMVFHRIGTRRGSPAHADQAIVVRLRSLRDVKALAATLNGYISAREWRLKRSRDIR